MVAAVVIDCSHGAPVCDLFVSCCLFLGLCSLLLWFVDCG